MASKRYGLHAVTINTAVFSGIKSYSFSPGIAAEAQGHDGIPYVDQAFIMNQEPGIRIRTNDIAGVLAAIGPFFLALTDVKLWFQLKTNKGTRTGGSAHVKGVMTSALVCMRTISAKHGQYTEAEIEIYPISSDGYTNPIAWTDAEALAGTPADVAHYTLGTLVVDPDGVTAAAAINIQGWDFDPGVQVEVGGDDGTPFPTHVHVETIDPSVSFQTHDMTRLPVMIAGQHVAADWYLQKMANHGMRVAKATEEHIKFSTTEALAYIDNTDVSHGGNATLSGRLKPVYDRTNLPVTVDVTAALPA